MSEKEAFERILIRERKARKEAERIMEEKSLELLKVNEKLSELNIHLEKEVADRTQEIKKNADQLNVLFNENPFPVIVYDISSLQILDVNNTAIEKYGYDKNEFLLKTVYNLHPNDEVERIEEYILARKTTNTRSSAWKHLSAMGNEFDVLVTSSPIIYNGTPCRMAIIEDITEKNILLREKDLQKQNYQDLIENSSDIIYRINPKGNFIYMNPSGIKMSGYSRDEILQMNFSDLIAPSYLKQVVNFYKFQMQEKLDTTYTEFPIITKEGIEYWIGQNVEASEFTEDGEVVYNATARNITERKKLEKAHLRSEEKYRSIIENMELGLLEVNVKGIITKAYPKFCLLTGYSHKELEGGKAEFLLDENGLSTIQEQTDSRKTGISNVYEIQLIRKDGSKIWVMISAAPFYDEYNRVQGSVGIHLDITNRKTLENDLLHSKTTAENLLKSKEMFIANVSHEIRTPLNAIIGITELMLNSSHDEALISQLDHVSHAGKGLLSLINELLLVSKIDADKLTLNPTNYSLSKCLNSNFELHKNEAIEKGLSYSIQFNIPETNEYCFDHLKLGQVVQNLLSNSLKFTKTGSVQLKVNLVSSIDNVDIIEISVIDTGIGIPKENLESIFGNFEQAINNQSGEYGGTGLGLSIVKKILALMGSEIKVESKNGQTAFVFQLKLFKTQLIEPTDFTSINQKGALHGVNVLVAEDNKANQFLIENVLKELDASFTIVNNGQEAIKYLRINSVDVILMDMRMPVMDGIEASRIIREENLHENKPIIALTANADDKNKSICLASGMDDFLAKPYTISDLVKRIKTALGQSYSIDTKPVEPFQIKNDSFQKRLNEIFNQDSQIRLVKLKEALISSDFDSIIDICHSMRPSLMEMGQNSLLKIAEKIESGDNLESNSKSFIRELEEYLIDLKSKV
ncbi:MAG: PAS domain S-box-containing protein [Crocinitomicaceae bacterium]|jgi:PAS domain S-box-containing protein